MAIRKRPLPCGARRRVPFGSVRDLSKAGASDERPVVVANKSLRRNREGYGIVDERFNDQILITVRLCGGVVILVDDGVRAIRHTVFLQIARLQVSGHYLDVASAGDTAAATGNFPLRHGIS